MRKRSSLALLVAVVGLLFVPVASHAADPCNGTIGGQSVRGNPTPVVSTGFIKEIDNPVTGKAILYLDVRSLADDQQAFSLWLYEETNTVADLQRGGHSIFPDTPLTNGEDPCVEAGAPNQDTCDTSKPTCHDQDIF